MTSGRRTDHLHLNRVSVPGTIYFVTGCTHYREPCLLEESIATSLLFSVKASDASKDTKTFAFTAMSDHWHWLFECGNRLSLGRIVARLKAQTGEPI